MPEGKDFQKTPLMVSVTLAFKPWLLEAVAAESRRLGYSFEEVLIATVQEKFAGKADAADEILR